MSELIANKLVEFVQTKVKPREFYSETFPGIRWPSGDSEGRVKCCFHTDKTPSLSLNPVTGAWYCHGCGVGGISTVSFYAKHKNTTVEEAAALLYEQYVRPLLRPSEIRAWHRLLYVTPERVKYLQGRYISLETIRQYMIGWTGTRLSIPVYDEFGLPVNCKLYDPDASKKLMPDGSKVPKMFSYKRNGELRSFGSPAMLYPLSSINSVREAAVKSNEPHCSTIFVCEGEWDALALISLGVPAVTTTNGSKSWPAQYNELFRGLDVVIAYDNDKDGTTYDNAVVFKHLHKIARTIKRINIPLEIGKDVTDWIKKDPEMRKARSWYKLVDSTPLLVENSSAKIEGLSVPKISLDQASLSNWGGKRIIVDALIKGKDSAPYLLPKVARVSCNRKCETCPISTSEKPYREVNIDLKDPDILTLIDAKKPQVTKALISRAGFDPSKECECKVDVIEHFNVEQVVIQPTIDSYRDIGQFVTRVAYFVGHGLFSNRSYEFEGVTTADPVDQHATHLFDRAKPAQDEVETFKMTKDLAAKLEVFQVKPGDSVTSHLTKIADWQASHITKIHERPDLHIAVDLVYHSLPSFEFNGEMVRRGMLDVLIFGDTRCGKGFVTEGLSRYYGLGSIASGENCSLAGLIGGAQTIGKSWMVTWGAIPLNNNRLVIIDEVSGISEQHISRMSRVRSEGVAEVNKIVHEMTPANVRLLWLSNTRTGRKISQYDTGIQAIKELIGANEDISRFDFAMTVAQGEVSASVMNARFQDVTALESNRYSRELCRSLVLWAWSRKKDQVKFDNEAVDLALQEALRLGSTFSSDIPLVQAENIRIKIAKISAAVAARVFSASPDGETVIVKREHVQAATAFLFQCYTKPSMGYDRYTEVTAPRTQALTDGQGGAVDREFAKLTETNRVNLIRGLLNVHKITAEALGDYLDDVMYARQIIGDLVKIHCLSRIESGGGWYLKTPAFNQWLVIQKGKGKNGAVPNKPAANLRKSSNNGPTRPSDKKA